MNTQELKLSIDRYVLAATIVFNIKREYITLGVPIVLSLLFLVLLVLPVVVLVIDLNAPASTVCCMPLTTE